jgi:hypothetical protein
MSIRVAFREGGYVATTTPPHGGNSTWESGAPTTGRELVDALLKLGCHQRDIADAFYAIDPDWIEHLDRRPE